MVFKNELLIHVGEAFSRNSVSVSGTIFAKYLIVYTVHMFYN